MKDFSKGEKYFLKCIQFNPKYYLAYSNLATLYMDQGRLDDAITWYKKAIDVNPRESYAYHNLGKIY
jgi:tetratricopeptide (TPR) repeat protein